jgi:thiol-disulfide isomerase/thioredoxin
MRSIVVLLALLVVVSAVDVVELGERNDGAIKTFETVVGKGKPSLVFFYLPGCGHCRGFHPEFDAAAGHFDSSNIIFAKVNAERWDILAKKYDVSRVPDIRYCSSSGDCQSYPEYAPNTEAGVVEYIEGKIGSRFVQTDADTEAHLASMTSAEKLAVQLTKGTCPVVHASLMETESEAAAAAVEEDETEEETEESDESEEEETDADEDEAEEEESEEEEVEAEETEFLELLAHDSDEADMDAIDEDATENDADEEVDAADEEVVEDLSADQ